MGERGFHSRPNVKIQAPLSPKCCNASMAHKACIDKIIFTKEISYYVKDVCIYLANGKKDPRKCKAEILESHKAERN